MALNILDNRFFTADHNYTYSLPELISELYKGHIEDLTALPAHEHSAFFTFLVQLSAMLRTKFNTQLSDCQDVRRGLIALTDGNEHSWDLIPEEGQGGFLQPFDPNQPPLAGRKKILSPCGIDTLYYSKGHSTKAMKAFGTSEEQWIYSLVAVQTSSAFSGGGRFGSIRTANTWSSRLFVSLVPIQGNDMRLHHSRWFKMQTDLLEEMRKSTNDPVLMDQYAKSAATWTQNWSGEKDALSIEDIDPHFIEVCRLIRLFQNEEGNIFAQENKKVFGVL